MDAVDRLDPLPPEVAGGVTFLVDRTRPAAALRAGDGSVRVVVWPDALLPARAASPSVWAARGCVWVVYAEDCADTNLAPAATAVRIGAGGQVGVCDLGELEAIGADDQGVWVASSPYLQLEEVLALGADAGPQGDGQAALGPPQWVESAPVVARADFERAQREAAQAQVAADLAQMTTAPPGVQEGESFGWFASPRGRQEREPLPQPPAPRATGPASLHRVGVDGRDQEMVVSRVVSAVEAIGDAVLRVVFHPTGLALSPDEYGGYEVHYPRRTAELDVSAGLPASVDLDALASQPLNDSDEDEDGGEEESVVDEGDRVDLAGIAGTRWNPRPSSDDQIAAAVQAVVGQYADLDVLNTVHTSRDDRWQRVASAYADLTVHVEGQWPGTEVVVDFTYEAAPGAPLRRRTRVFDDAGAPAASP